jgi:hypothetical protein
MWCCLSPHRISDAGAAMGVAEREAERNLLMISPGMRYRLLLRPWEEETKRRDYVVRWKSRVWEVCRRRKCSAFAQSEVPAHFASVELYPRSGNLCIFTTKLRDAEYIPVGHNVTKRGWYLVFGEVDIVNRIFEHI